MPKTYPTGRTVNDPEEQTPYTRSSSSFKRRRPLNLREEQCEAANGAHNHTQPQPAVRIKKTVFANKASQTDAFTRFSTEMTFLVFGRYVAQRLGGQHLGWPVDKIHRRHGRAIELVEVEPCTFMIWIGAHGERLAMLTTALRWYKGGKCTLYSSVWLYLVYIPISSLHGSDSSWRPSTAIGVKCREPSASIVYVPCCHCIIPFGHDGSCAVNWGCHQHVAISAVKIYTYGWK